MNIFKIVLALALINISLFLPLNAAELTVPKPENSELKNATALQIEQGEKDNEGVDWESLEEGLEEFSAYTPEDGAEGDCVAGNSRD